MQDGIERRKSERVTFTSPVEYTPYALLLPRLEPASLQGTSVDASADDRGLSFVTGHPLFTGRKLRVVSAGVARRAEVRWVGTDPTGYRAGVRFNAAPGPTAAT